MTGCGDCGNEGRRVVLYTVRRPPREGIVLCGPCIMRAGGQRLLHAPEESRFADDGGKQAR